MKEMKMDTLKKKCLGNRTDVEKRKPISHVFGICIAILPVVILVSILYQTNRPAVFTVSNDTLKISSSYGETIQLSDIKSLELKDSLPQKLSKTNGSDFGSILKGNFKADGRDAKVFTNAAKPPFVYIETTDGLIILNDKNQAKTEAFYNELKSVVR
ncbi:MAG: hypothetical protein Q8865_08545 [Bacillota bacterium]|nr:hypothetical protein [Bacillota bacterium]